MVRIEIRHYRVCRAGKQENYMIYSAHEMQKSWLTGAGFLAQMQADWLKNPVNPFGYLAGGPIMASALEVFAHAAEPRGKPDFGLTHVEADGNTYSVEEAIECRKPFGQLKHFIHAGAVGAPKLLIVAPMSGHYATLLRGTVERMLPGHDVWITDWRDARDVAASEGTFDLDDYVDYLVGFLEHIGSDESGRGAHILAVCQPSVPCYAAACLMSADKHPCRPKSLTMMGGPIDTRKAPTAVNTLSTTRPHSWFQQNAICIVPGKYRGAGRKVYPGFLQLSGFMSMNLGNHLSSHWEMFKHLVTGDGESANATKDFYDEYRSVCDMTAEFYLQTVEAVFQEHLLPKGEYLHRGRAVDPAAITDIALLAIEGERDDISGIGQTKAALDIAVKLPEKMKHYHLAPEVGHYGIFNGSKWRDKIAPVVEEWIKTHS
jgi:poly(3-hydroxybutyrate) depolymerase